MASKITIVLVILAVLVTWLLISSINQVSTPSSPSGGGGSTTGGSNGGNSGGSHGGLGGFSLPGFNFPFSFKFPDLSNLFKFNFPKFSTSLKVGAINLSWLKFRFPDILNLGHLSNGGIKIKGFSFPSGISNAAGKVTDLVHIPAFVFYILIAVLSVIILFGAYSAVRNRPEHSGDQEGSAASELQLTGGSDSGSDSDSYSYRIAPYPGWNYADHFIQPLNGHYYPLLGGAGEPFAVSLPEGAAVQGVTISSVDRQGNIAFTLMPGCNTVSARYRGTEDSLGIRGVRYGEEVVKLARANMINGKPSNLTLREIAADPVFTRDVLSADGLNRIIAEFEKVKYGKIQPSADAFRQYVMDIGKAIRAPVVIICSEEEPVG